MNYKLGLKRLWIFLTGVWLAVCVCIALVQVWVLYQHNKDAARLLSEIQSKNFSGALEERSKSWPEGTSLKPDTIPYPVAEEEDHLIENYLIEKHLGSLPFENILLFIIVMFLPPIIVLLLGKTLFWVFQGFRKET